MNDKLGRIDADSLLQQAILAVALGSPWAPPLAHEAARAVERDGRVLRIAAATGERDWTWSQRKAEAQRAVELAERVGAADARSSTEATWRAVERYIEAVEWRAARGEPLPKDEEEMRRAAVEHLNATMLPGIS